MKTQTSTATIVALSIIEGLVGTAAAALLFGAIAAALGQRAWEGALWCAPIVLGATLVYGSLSSFQAQLELRGRLQKKREGDDDDGEAS